MKRTHIAIAALAACTAVPALAQGTPPAADYTLTANVGLFSDYRFRGFTQTDYNPAIQGGFDWAHKSGLYLGNWNSNVSSAVYNGAPIEMDFYGGWRTTIEGFGLDLGVLYYYYPGSGQGGAFKVDNTELYIGGSWGPISLKYNYAVSDFFGIPGTSGAYYFLLSGAHDFGNGFGLNASVGYQGGLKSGDNGYSSCVTEFGGNVACSITDYKLGGTYTIDGWVIGLAYVSTNRDIPGSTDQNISNGTALLSVTKTF